MERKSQFAINNPARVKTIAGTGELIGGAHLFFSVFGINGIVNKLHVQPPIAIDRAEVVRLIAFLVVGLTGVGAGVLVRRRIADGIPLAWSFAASLIAWSLFLIGAAIQDGHATDFQRLILPIICFLASKAVIKALRDSDEHYKLPGPGTPATIHPWPPTRPPH